MADVEDQNPAGRRPVWIGEVVGSNEGLTRVPFQGLDGGVWLVGADGSEVVSSLRCGFGPANGTAGARGRCTGASLGCSRSRGRATRRPTRLAQQRRPDARRGALRRYAQVRRRASSSRGASTTRVAEQVRKHARRPCFTSLSTSWCGVQGRSPALARLAAAASWRVAARMRECTPAPGPGLPCAAASTQI
jgi:hypothetical protein